MKEFGREMRLITAMAGLTCLLISSNTAAALASEEAQANESTCAFVVQLQNEEARIEFVASVDAAKQAAASPYGERVLYSATYSGQGGEAVQIDTFSQLCLSCHDGINAKSFNIRYKNNSHSGSIDMQSVRGGHPIGMHYGSYAYANRELRGLYEIDPNMVLVDGKVGCLTCHNPLNPEKNHLISKNLCMSCHVR